MIRSIKTPYAGVVFQSTLEADWAKTLSKMNPPIRWMYEPEGLRLPDGQNYRCDMFLPRLNTWLEVKGPHDQRIDKPGLLAEAVLHAPGCELGRPTQTLTRPDSVPPASCPCGYGPDFPFQNVVVGRPATNGKLTFEPPHGLLAADTLLVVLTCPVCRQNQFTDANGVPLCRRCHQVATGGKAFRSGQLPFQRVEPPRGRRRRAAHKTAA